MSSDGYDGHTDVFISGPRSGLDAFAAPANSQGFGGDLEIINLIRHHAPGFESHDPEDWTSYWRLVSAAYGTERYEAEPFVWSNLWRQDDGSLHLNFGDTVGLSPAAIIDAFAAAFPTLTFVMGFCNDSKPRELQGAIWKAGQRRHTATFPNEFVIYTQGGTYARRSRRTDPLPGIARLYQQTEGHSAIAETGLLAYDGTLLGLRPKDGEWILDCGRGRPAAVRVSEGRMVEALFQTDDSDTLIRLSDFDQHGGYARREAIPSSQMPPHIVQGMRVGPEPIPSWEGMNDDGVSEIPF